MDAETNSQPAGLQRVAIIGGGVAGLTAAYDLTRPAMQGRFAVTLFESAANLGGLAAGFKGRPEWEWPLEHYYHHLFLSDRAMLGLLDEIGFAHALKSYRPNTAIHTQGKNYPLDSVTRVLRFPLIPFVDRVRMGMVIGYLRYHPAKPWRDFDKILADEWLRAKMGSKAYEAAWEFQLQGKFGAYYKQVNLAWFWARVYARTPKLAYFDGGFQAFVDHLAGRVRSRGAQIHTGATVEAIRPRPGGGYDVVTGGQAQPFDRVLSTTSPELMTRLAPDLPADYLGQLGRLNSMGAVVLTVALDRKLTADQYWISLPKREGIPFLALVEHTNMIDPAHYGGDHLLYLGDYLPPDHRYFDLSAEELLDEFAPHLVKFNPAFRREWVTGAWVHSAKYAQPVPPVGYLAMIPDLRTPLPGLYFASMSQVYPWDRGTNYAVELGRKVAALMAGDAES
ncbi:MAG: NAD(P)/FAD-dependent oxidoreductase [Caldilineaceae bacterium]|nr:NAD(P)/FAD-dependent oxidoreductase [Caldilineaceae bacterium]MCB9124268.1 NAD(P)/FAD-dependent oxidoreductase [Caldilineaceae bacterium]